MFFFLYVGSQFNATIQSQFHAMNGCTGVDDVDDIILSFRGDWEAITRRLLHRLNEAVRRRATVRHFRPISMAALLSRALRLYNRGVELLGPRPPRSFFYAVIMNFFSRWATNNGVIGAPSTDVWYANNGVVGAPTTDVWDRMVALSLVLGDWLAGEPPFAVSRDWLT